jgi:2-hydroxychromene-2-carboxylate isomerase
MKADWFFDYISPYSYLQSTRLHELAKAVTLHLRPVLFAVLLDANGQLGPAEIPAKRNHTFRQVLWLAQRDRIPMKLPPVHPFNPLPLLRLTLASGSTPEVVRTIFDFVWREGRDPGNAREWQSLCERLGIQNADALIGDPRIKEQLRQNGEQAIARGVFGVPTLMIDDEAFWGYDATDYFLDYVSDPAAVRLTTFDPVARLAEGPARRRKPG